MKEEYLVNSNRENALSFHIAESKSYIKKAKYHKDMCGFVSQTVTNNLELANLHLRLAETYIENERSRN